MKLTTGILAVALMTGGAAAQNPDAIDNARSTAKSLQQTPTRLLRPPFRRQPSRYRALRFPR
jgi:hypothetical protein